mgnify:CR=1 FL=1
MKSQQLKKIILFSGLIILFVLIYFLVVKIDIDKLPSIRFPIGFVGSQVVFLNDYKDVYKVLKDKEGLTKNQAIKQLNESLKDQYIINKQSKKLKLDPIPLKDVNSLNNQETKTKANELSNELYGWSIEKFERLVIKPLELRRGLVNWYYQENNLSIKNKLEEYKVANNASEKIKKDDNYTYYGFVSLDAFDPAIQLVLLNQKPDSISDVVENETAYNLVVLHSVLVKDGLYEVGLLSFKKRLFNDWLEEQTSRVRMFTVVK